MNTRWGLLALILSLTGCAASALTPTRPAPTAIISLPSPSPPGPSPSPTHLPATPTCTPAPTATATRIAPSRTPSPAPSSSSTMTVTMTMTRTPSPSSTMTMTPIPWSSRRVIGRSVQGRDIEALRLGLGPHRFFVVGGIHGGSECNTSALVERLAEHILARPDLIPPDVTLYLVPLLNPDGCALETRFNARGVDLNRNWGAQDWTTDAEWSGGVLRGSGGTWPFSEPETNALRAWLLALDERPRQGALRGIFYHSAVPPTGLAQPGQGASALARAYAGATGYRYSTEWVGDYVVTGGAIDWAAEHGLLVMNVELPDHDGPDAIPPGWSETHFETNLRGLLQVLHLRPTPRVPGVE